MSYLLDTIRPRLAKPIVYTTHEDRVMRDYNLFMTAVTEFLPVERMAKNAEMVFCIFAACALEEAWKKYLPTAEGDVDTLRFLEILVRYLRNAMKVQEGCVIAFVEEGQELVSSDFGSNVAKLAAKTFKDFTDGEFNAAAGFKFFVDQINLEHG